MTSIRQTKKYEKKLVAKGFILLDEPRKWHYSREYKRFHAAIKKLLSSKNIKMFHYDKRRAKY